LSSEKRGSNVILSAENLSGDPDLDLIARQFTDAAVWTLSDNYLTTAQPHAVDHATRLSDAELQDIGRKFDTHFVVVYALRKEGEGISVTATVVDVRTGMRVLTDNIVTSAYRTLADQRIEAAELSRRIMVAE
jgi:TolB-like protein